MHYSTFILFFVWITWLQLSVNPNYLNPFILEGAFYLLFRVESVTGKMQNGVPA